MRAAIEERLANWGRWSRTGKHEGNGSSPLYRLMKENDPSFSPSEPRILPDDEDAVFMDRVIMETCNQLELEILRCRYIGQLTDVYICRRTHVRFSDFYPRIRKILQKLDIAVKQFKICVEN